MFGSTVFNVDCGSGVGDVVAGGGGAGGVISIGDIDIASGGVVC